MIIRSGTVSMSGIVPGIPSLFVDNCGSFAARKNPFYSIKFPGLNICDFGLSSLPF